MENINTDTNNQRPNPVLRLELDAHTLAFLSLSKLMDHPPSVVEELTDLERHLLINDNAVLGLDHDAPSFPPTIDQSDRQVERVEGKNQGGSYVDTYMPQWYESSHITAIVQDQTGAEANSRPTDPLRLAKFCL